MLARIKIAIIQEERTMSTPKLIWFPGACFNLTARGNRKEHIFRDRDDFEYYLKVVEETIKYFQEDMYQIICYCLMNNHVHILLKTKFKPPGKFIGRINSIYTRYFNRKYNYIGHLFQGRYHREIIESNGHMLEACRYIHLNPVRANLVSKPEEYQWSSHRMYIGIQEEKIISSEMILEYFWGKDPRSSYKNFMEISGKTPQG